jgi:D-sedoheptulose 7-phosphate isomerase
MLIGEELIGSMRLGARASEFQSLISSVEIMDAAGKALQVEQAMLPILTMLRDLRKRKGALFLVGNGGSAAIASHAATDFLNVGELRATTLHDPSLLTCMANDYGYEAAFERILSVVAKPDDMLISISSSGRSMNIRNAAAKMREIGGSVITLSGFDKDNPLRGLGDFNVWLNSRDYGFVEIGHQFILHNLADRLRVEQKISA